MSIPRFLSNFFAPKNSALFFYMIFLRIPLHRHCIIQDINFIYHNNGFGCRSGVRKLSLLGVEPLSDLLQVCKNLKLLETRLVLQFKFEFLF